MEKSEQTIPNQFEEAIIQLINGAKEVGSNAYDFALEQSPLLVEEVIKWGIAYHFTLVILGILLLFLCVFTFFKHSQWSWVKKLDEEGQIITKLAICVLSGMIGIIVFLSNIFVFIKVLVAPRLYFLEIVGDLLK